MSSGVGAVVYPPKITQEAFRQAVALLAPGFDPDDLLSLEIREGVVTVTLRCVSPEGALLLGATFTREIVIAPEST
jgi:hypothetical protein